MTPSPAPMPIALVTGATGYIGTHLVARLAQDGRDVHVVVRSNSDTRRLPAGVHVHQYDGTASSLHQVFADAIKDRPCSVFHLAAHFQPTTTCPESITQMLTSNIVLGTQLLDAAAMVRRHEQTCMVSTGSYWQFAEDGTVAPNSAYAAMKQAFSEMLDYYVSAGAVTASTLILYDVYGTNDWRPKLIPQLCSAIIENVAIETTPGQQLLDLVWIDDVVNAMLAGEGALVSDRPTDHPRWAVDSGARVTLRQLVRCLEQVTGRTVPVKWGARPYPPHQIMTPAGNIPRVPGWSPAVDLATGLTNVWQDMCNRIHK